MEKDYEGYYKGIGNDPLDAVDSILRELKYLDGGEIEFWKEESGKSVNIDNEAECTSPLNFQCLIYGIDRNYYVLAGIVAKKSTNTPDEETWEAGAEMEKIVFP